MRQEQNSSICISIHALREEGDPTTPVTVRCMFLFLSTPSARRATERLDEGVGDVVISIHALREEGDTTSRNSKTA